MSDIVINGVTYPAERRVAFPGSDGQPVIFDLPTEAEAVLNGNSTRPPQTKAVYSALQAETTARALAIQTEATARSQQIAALQAAVGTPLKAATAAGMTDTTKIYVYTGSETGYTAGNWYYHNGSAWVSGGVYNSQALETDKTLTVNGAAADARYTGWRMNRGKRGESALSSAVCTKEYVSTNEDGLFLFHNEWRYTGDGASASSNAYKSRSLTTYGLATSQHGTTVTVDPVPGKNYYFNVLCFSAVSSGGAVSSPDFVMSPAGGEMVPAGERITFRPDSGALYFIVQVRNLGTDAADASYSYYKVLTKEGDAGVATGTSDEYLIPRAVHIYRADVASEDALDSLSNFVYTDESYSLGSRVAIRLGYGISTSTGNNTTDAKKASTWGPQGPTTKWIKGVRCTPPETAYSYRVLSVGYELDGTFIGAAEERLFDGTLIAFDPSWGRFGLIFRRTDGADMTEEDVTAIQSLVHIAERTDRTLSVSAAPADAYETGLAVGNAIRNDPAAVAQLIAVAKTWHDNRTTAYTPGTQAMHYHDAATPEDRASILDVTTATVHTPNIECSTFVGMLLRGYSFDETTYSPEWTGGAMARDDWVANPEHFWAINPFEWRVSSRGDGTNPAKVRIAAALGRWMEDHGLAVPAAKMEPGDVVFFARKNSADDSWANGISYRHISHVALCYAVETTQSGNIYDIDPEAYPLTHFIIESSTDEADLASGSPAIEPYGDTDQGQGHGSIYIRPIETRPGPYRTGPDTLCLVCRPRLGTMWDEARHKETEAIKAAIRALGGTI